MDKFLHGLDLCESFFNEIARPLLATEFPSLQYSAGLIGHGSDVLGFDDEMSTDHMWGPRFQLFLPSVDFEVNKSRLNELFSSRFPYLYKGCSVNFSPPDAQDDGVRVQEVKQSGRVEPLIEYHTPTSFFLNYLGWDPAMEITHQQWLTISENRLLGATSGRIFHDGLGIAEIRQKLAYFPHEVWLWLMASQWKMIAEEEPFTGRCGSVGDDLGSRIVASRQIQRLMRLAFLMEKRYAPYSKWLGTAFTRLPVASQLLPLLDRVLKASEWKERDEYLGKAYSILAEKHNSLKVTGYLTAETSGFFNRPFNVISGERFSKALHEVIRDPWLRSLPPIGSVSQLTESVTVYDDVLLSRKLAVLYQ